TVVADAVGALNKLGGLTTAREQFTENYIAERQGIPEDLFQCLVFMRANLPSGTTVAADPEIMRTIPLVANVFVVHSGVPFDFVEDYFLRYYEATIDEETLRKAPTDNTVTVKGN